MKLISKTTASIAAATVLAVGAGGIAVADAATGHSGTASTKSSSSTGTHKHKKGSLLRRTEHATLTQRAPKAPGKTRTLDLQRGTVTAVSASSITLRSLDGYTQTYAVTSTTKVRSDGKTSSIADVQSGEVAFVTAVEGTSGSQTAVAIRGVHQPKAHTSPSATSSSGNA